MVWTLPHVDVSSNDLWNLGDDRIGSDVARLRGLEEHFWDVGDDGICRHVARSRGLGDDAGGKGGKTAFMYSCGPLFYYSGVVRPKGPWGTVGKA